MEQSNRLIEPFRPYSTQPLSRKSLRVSLDDELLNRYKPAVSLAGTQVSNYLSPRQLQTEDYGYPHSHLSSRNLMHSPSASSVFGNFPTSTRTQEPTYSTAFVAELEKQHEKAMAEAYARLRDSEINHTKEIESIKNSMLSIQQRFEGDDQKHLKELDIAREMYQDRILEQLREKECMINDTNMQLSDISHKLNCETDRVQQLQNQLQIQRVQYDQEVTDLRGKIRELEKSIEENEKDHEKNMDQAKIESIKELGDLQNIIEAKDKLISNLHEEITDHKQENEKKVAESQNEMGAFKNEISALRTIQDAAESTNNQQKVTIQSTQRENKLLRKETKLLAKELKTLKFYAKKQSESSGKLERLVYGRKIKSTKTSR